MFALDRFGCTYSYACPAERLSCPTSSSSLFSAGGSSQGSSGSKEGLCMAEVCLDAALELRSAYMSAERLYCSS